MNHLSRLRAILSLSMLLTAVCSAQSPAAMQSQLDSLSAKLGSGRFGIAVVDLASGRRFSVEGEQRFPMMSDFKAPLAAAILSRVDAHTLSLARTVTLNVAEYVPGSAVPSIGAKLAHGPITVTISQLLAAAISQSDNTSCDALLRLLGGPQALTRYLAGNGLAGTEVRAGEGGMAAIFNNLHGARQPAAGETMAQRQQRLEAGYKAFVADPPNTTTPDAAALFLVKLWKGELLSHSSTQYLLRLMYAQTIPLRLRAGLPPGFRFADKTGTTGTLDGRTAAFNDMGIVTAPDRRTVVIATFMTDTDATFPQRNALYAALMRAVASDLLSPSR